MKFNNIGEVIYFLRKREKLTRNELGDKAGLSKSIIAKIENNQRALSLEEMINISEVFSTDVQSMYSYLDADKEILEGSFVKVFKDKGIDNEYLLEIKRIELLIDALITQKEILRNK